MLGARRALLDARCRLECGSVKERRVLCGLRSYLPAPMHTCVCRSLEQPKRIRVVHNLRSTNSCHTVSA